ncbi:hypothetical protein [Herbidospora mongoliensis]|uniref:hypothetical protein n=1 Tax=Herbidospora mongoliensis TaxID=688067 RepID=UPI00082E1C26|nr:hypothetical protein [Herbidospora mongoliensis]
MRILISALSAAALLLTATPAQAAAPKDPVKAVRALLSPGKGVRFTDVTDIVTNGDGVTVQRRTGSLMFGKGRIAASDITATWEKTPFGDSHDNGRTIRIGREPGDHEDVITVRNPRL